MGKVTCPECKEELSKISIDVRLTVQDTYISTYTDACEGYEGGEVDGMPDQGHSEVLLINCIKCNAELPRGLFAEISLDEMIPL